MIIGAFTKEQWQVAFEAAENNGFDEIDSLEDPDGGALASYVAQLYTHEQVGQDEGILWAAIQVAGEVWGLWEAKQFEKLLAAYNGEKQSDQKSLIEEYLEDHYGSFPIEEIRDQDEFYKEYVVASWGSDLYALNEESGNTIHFFDKNQL